MLIDTDDRFLLTSQSDATEAPTEAAIHLSRDGHSPNIRAGSHGAEVDTWGVATYLSGPLKECFVKGQC